MIDKFLTAYQTWPPEDQLKFAIIGVAIGAGLMLCFGIWGVGLFRDLMFYCSVWWRGWPEYQEHVGGLLPLPPTRPEMPQMHPLATLRKAIADKISPRTQPATPPVQPTAQPTAQKPPIPRAPTKLPPITVSDNLSDARTSHAPVDPRLPTRPVVPSS